DLAQTHESLLKYFAEEVQEFIDAMRSNGAQAPATWEELGDVMLQVALHSKLAEEKGITDFDEICSKAADKLILRHPHVFDPDFPRFKRPEEVSASWEQIKAWAREKQASQSSLTEVSAKPSESAPPQPVLPKASQVESVPLGLSPLLRSSRIGEKAAA